MRSPAIAPAKSLWSIDLAPGLDASVTDNGIGMPSDSDKSKPGLGTNIVEALAKRLDAGVEVSRANPGTVVSIVHAPCAIPLREKLDAAHRPQGLYVLFARRTRQ